MASAQKIDGNGFMTVKSCPISSFGIFDYSAGQLGLPGDPNRIVKVYRPESAVSDPEAIKSFQNVPFIIDHEMLSGFEGDDSAEAPESYGIDGVLSNVGYASPWMRGDINIYTRKAQNAIRSGKKELSLGYGCDFLEQPGIWDGQPYEVVQTNMRGNHIALVDKARVSGARILDGLCFDSFNFSVQTSQEKPMALSKAAKDNAIEKLKALLPELEALIGTSEGGEGSGSAGGEGAAADPDAAAATASNGATQTSEEVDAGAGENEGEGAGGEEGPGELAGLIAQAKALIANLEAAAAGGAGAGDEGAMENGAARDTVEGLQNEGGASGSDEGEGGAVAQNGGTASPGPREGINATAGDAAVRRLYADLAVKDRLVKRLSAVVGAFDHAAMDAHQVAAYGVKKIGLKNVAKGSEMSVLDGYLTGVEKTKATNAQAVQRTVAADAAENGEMTDAFAAYLNA